tara:strand:- start:2476 stop:3312 length:837 start_codon:yes stop_codon:yes gene_type:complete
MEINSLIEDIHTLVTEGVEETTPQFLEELGESIKNSIKHQMENRKGNTNLRMSNIGKPDRQLWYQCNGTKGEPLLPDTRIKFMFGDLVEALMLYLVKEAGHEVTHEQHEVQIEGIKGHIDCKIDGKVVDVKSASAFAFQKFKNGTLPEDDPFGYMAQISGYIHATEGSNEGGFLALNKQSGAITYMPVEDMDMVNIKKRVKEIKKVVKQKEIPDRCYEPVADGKSGNMKLGVNCSYCDYKWECWPGLRLFLYRDKPRYLTHVEREPQESVPEVKRHEI